MGEYVVESIEGDKLFSHRKGRKIRKYLVRWRGYVDTTWEPLSNLRNCPDKLAEYKARTSANSAAVTQENPSVVQEHGNGIAMEVDELNAPTQVGSEETKQEDEEIKCDEDRLLSVHLRLLRNSDKGTPQVDNEETTEEDHPRASNEDKETTCDEERFLSDHLRLRHANRGDADGDGDGDDVEMEDCEETKQSDTEENCIDVYDYGFDDSDKAPTDDDGDSTYADDDHKGTNDPVDDSSEDDNTRAQCSKPMTKRNSNRASKAIAKAKSSSKSKKIAASREPSLRRKSNAMARSRIHTEGYDFLGSDDESSAGDELEDFDDSDDASDDAETIIQIAEASSEEDDDVIDVAATKDLTSVELRKMAEDGFVDAYYGDSRTKSYEADDLYQDPPSLTEKAAEVAQSMRPIDLFFFFFPKALWREISMQTNKYEKSTRSDRMAKARARNDSLPERQAEARLTRSRKQIVGFEQVKPVEILHVMGLLLARSMCPHKAGINQHWTRTSNGAIPAGTWSNFMPRQRFRDIMRFLHFSDNNDPRAQHDRAWKIRPVVETLQTTFAKGLQFGRWVAFDEMVIPSRSSRNAIRIYLKNKPHKYGTKLFAVCCGETKYCARVDVYCGSRQDTRHVDTFAGPAAVIRNIQALWPDPPDSEYKRVVVTDREYTSISLSTRLLKMGFYNVGTVTPSRLGFPKDLKYSFKKVPKSMMDKRGLCRLKRCVSFPDVFSCSWLDNKPVYFLASGVSTTRTSIRRKMKNGSSMDVPCPEFIEAYNNYMNGVDAHDQLRLQRYSVQRSVRYAKYYKMLFLGLFDMGLVNAYVVHREYCKAKGQKPLSQANFRIILHEQLLGLTAGQVADVPPRDVSADQIMHSGSVTTHTLLASTDKKPSGGTRFRVCKVCAVLHTDRTTSIPTTRWYCRECSTE
jgi:hypothetical protein